MREKGESEVRDYCVFGRAQLLSTQKHWALGSRLKEGLSDFSVWDTRKASVFCVSFSVRIMPLFQVISERNGTRQRDDKPVDLAHINLYPQRIMLEKYTILSKAALIYWQQAL